MAVEWDTLITWYDENIVKDLLSDTGVQISDLASDTKLPTLLAAAEGRVESACSVANAYTPEVLQGLTGNSLALYQEIVCGLCIARLLRRRPGQYSEIADAVKEYEDYLDRLRKGERVFGSEEENREAALPSVDGPTVADYSRLNLIPDRTLHFYPSRASRLPIGR